METGGNIQEQLQPSDIIIRGSLGFSREGTLVNGMREFSKQKPSNSFKYSRKSHFPDIQKFTDKFSVEELWVADALWHNVTNRLIVDFQQNIIAVIRYMRELRLLVTSLKSKIKEQSCSPMILERESGNQKTELSGNRCYERIEFSVNLQVPLKSDQNACIPPPNQEFKSDKSLAMTWASRITEGEHPEGTSLINGYLPCLPIISVKVIEDTAFLGKEISEQLTAIEDFLPVQISVWSTAPDYSQGSYVSEFHLLRIIDEEPEGLKTLASDEVEPVNFDPEDLIRMRGHAIKVITEKLQDTTEKWYTLYSSERCIIQTAEPYDGKIAKGKQKQTVKIPATLLDAAFIGHFDLKTRERLKAIVVEDT
ncbi:hypothetical protein FH972_016803 [Carpinus fangiana]|uniref:Uncharacterized protein n=1 Tax=Carpinus fangiana TaxID=176857 RepID=A0A5N6RH07_9ROSI|nr:hypothetical protein FH972_016803 [Carpinus fangiana]